MTNDQVKKVDLKSLDIKEQSLEKLKEIFPAAFTEGKVDFKKLEQLLGEDVEKGIERYNFTWPGKSNAIKEISAPSLGTLKPARDESVNFDETENLFIEADNLEALKLLQKSYLGKIKMIYIDPPYNTGKDFVYKDNFGETLKDYLEFTQQKDEEGKVFTTNPDSAGRYHSNWLNMMYPRLYLARNLLSVDGVIFISIDEVENANLKKICDEIFGENNYLTTISIVTGASQNGEGVKFQNNNELCLVYAKKQDRFEPNKVDKADDSLRSLADSPSPLHTRPDMGYTIYYNPSTRDIIPIKDYEKEKIKLNDEKLVYSNNQKLISEGYVPVRPGMKNNLLHRWRWGFDTFIERKNEIIIKENSRGEFGVFFKQTGYNPPKNVMNFGVGTAELKRLFDDTRIFDFPKSTAMLKYLIKVGSNEDDIVLDFFAGSGTTAHAVLDLNNEEASNRKFITVQLPEPTNINSEAYKAGYKNISDIAKERIRRVIAEIKKQSGGKNNFGFKAFRLDKSNFNAWDGTDLESLDAQLQLGVDRVDPKSTDEDILYEVMLKDGFMLTEKPEIKNIDGKRVHSFGDGFLLVCLEKNLTKEFIKQMAELMPKTEADATVIFLDEGFHDNDQLLVNAVEIFKSRNEKINFRIV